MIYQICEFEMNNGDGKKVTLNAEGNKRYIEFFNGEKWIFSISIDREKANEVYKQIIDQMINGYKVYVETYGIF